MNSRLREGWVPIRLAWQLGQQGRELVAEWCWLGGERFLDPFFDNTIEHARRLPFNRLFTHRTPISELAAWHAASPGMPPTGFIFHMSRCGSTLVSQMLAALPENVVVSEAGPIDSLARAAGIPDETRRDWLRWTVSALGQKRSGKETRYFIKFDSVTVDALPFIRSAFPAVPWIFLYRHPEEVLTSHLREPAAAMSPGIVRGPAVIDRPMSEILSMAPEEYAARVIGTLCRRACQSLNSGGMPVNYRQLPAAVWQEIAPHFGIRFSKWEIETMQRAALFNAKRPRQRFEADGDSKRREITARARETAVRWIQPHYEELEALRLSLPA